MARGSAAGPLLLDRRARGVRIVPHLAGTGRGGRGGGHGTGGSLLDSTDSSLAPLPGCLAIPSGVHIDACAKLPAGGSGCASRSLTWLLEHGILRCEYAATNSKFGCLLQLLFDRSMSGWLEQQRLD